MATRITFTRPADIPTTLEIMEYLVTVTKSGQFVTAILHRGYSGHSMWDWIDDYRHQYPAAKGYLIEW